VSRDPIAAEVRRRWPRSSRHALTAALLAVSCGNCKCLVNFVLGIHWVDTMTSVSETDAIVVPGNFPC
jgi:hypothetical protein